MTVRLVRTLLSAALAAAVVWPLALHAQAPAAAPPASQAAPAPAPDAAPAPAPRVAPGSPDATEPPRVRTSELIEQAKSRLDQVTAALRRDSLDDATLSTLRDSLTPAADQIKQAIATLTPRIAEAKDRLDKLGPKPDAKAPPESADVAADRAEQQRRFDRATDLLKRAQLLAVQIDQTSARIVSRRRELFVGTLMQRSYSLLSPALWAAAVKELPGDFRALGLVAGDFVGNAADRLAGWRLAAFFALAALVASLNGPIYRYARRVLSREPTVAEPTRLRKALGACWTALLVAAPPLVTIFALFALLDAFDLMSVRLTPFKRAFIEGVARVAFVAGVARGLFAPSRPSWRLMPVSDVTAERLSRLAIAQAAIVSIVNVAEALTDISASSLPVTAAVQGVGAVVFGAVTAGAIYGLGEDDEDDECLGPRVTPRPRWIGFVRLVAWIVVAVMMLAAFAGYIPAAWFLSEQFVWAAGVVGLVSIALPLAMSAIEATFQPTTPFGRTMMSGLGVRRDGVTQLGIILSGVVHILLFVVALVAIVAPWGLQSDDLFGGLRNAYFGFKVGGVTISPSNVVVAVVLFALGYLATRALQNWLDDRLMPATSLDAGLRNSIRTSVGYVGVFVALAMALGQVGLGIQKIAIVAGALSVGIGFGLQSIVNNFVSGLILLWERSIRVGDWVVVGDEQGYVRKINVRSTEIETFDRATMIVPNSNLISGVVKNWVRNDRVGRIRVPLTLNTGVDPEKVREIMTGAAKGHEKVSKIPAPTTLFVGMEPTGLKFELICFVDDVEASGRIKSDLHYEIFREFSEAGISIAAPAAVSQVALQGPVAEAVADAIRKTGA